MCVSYTSGKNTGKKNILSNCLLKCLPLSLEKILELGVLRERQGEEMAGNEVKKKKVETKS